MWVQRHRDLESKLSCLSLLGDCPGEGCQPAGKVGKLHSAAFVCRFLSLKGRKGGPVCCCGFQLSLHSIMSSLTLVGRWWRGLRGALFPQRWLMAVLTAPKDARRGKTPVMLVFHHHALVN